MDVSGGRRRGGRLAGRDRPARVRGLMRGLAALSSCWVLNIVSYALVLVLLVLRRFRHMIIWLILATLLALIGMGILGPVTQRPRPFGVEIREGWGGWAMPAMQVTFFAVGLVAILYSLVPEGRWRNTGKWVVTALVALNALGRMALGADAPTDVLVGVALGVTIPLVAFRWFTPNEVFPITYRGGSGAHLDVGGARGAAIRRGLEDQLGLVVTEVKPFGLSGSAGSTPLRITVEGDPPAHAVRQAVRPQPPALGPLVQAGPRAAVRPAGGREAVQHRPAAGPAGGLRPVADAAGRAAQPDPVRVRRAHPRTGVPAGHRVLRRRHRARRGRGRHPGDRRRPRHHPQAVGRRAGPPRHQAGQPAGPRRPHAADRRRLRPGPAQPLAPGRRPGQHDAVSGPALQPGAGLRAGRAPVLGRGDHRGVRGRPRAGPALPAPPDAAGPGPRPARRVRAHAADPAPAGLDPAVEPGGGSGSWASRRSCWC